MRQVSTMLGPYRLGVISSLMAALVVALTSISLAGNELRYATVLPMAYILACALVLKVTWHSGPSVFLLVSLPVAFARYVVFPGTATANQGYVGRSPVPPSDESYLIAALLMAYELLVFAIVVMLFEPRIHREPRPSSVAGLRALPFWYIATLGIVSALLLIAFPESRQLLNIINPSSLDLDTVPALAVLSAFSAVATTSLIVVGFIARLSMSTRFRLFAPWAALLFGLVNVTIYVGTNRIALVLTVLATSLVVLRSFGRRATVPLLIGAVLSALVLINVTNYRQYAQVSDSPLEAFSDLIQVYAGGIYNVAIGVETAQAFPEASSWLVLLYDLLRPTIGFNLLVQDWDVKYSNVFFNYRIWGHQERRSQIFPMIAQGSLFFTPLFAPVLSAMFISLAYILMARAQRCIQVELWYFTILVVMRLSLFWGQNTMNLLNFISLNLIIPLALVVPYLLLRTLFSPGGRLRSKGCSSV